MAHSFATLSRADFSGGARTVSHELGHALTLGHATYNDPAARRLNPRSGEYQDRTSVMGRGATAAFNLPNRLTMNWIPASAVALLYDEDLEATCGGGNTVAYTLHSYAVEAAGPAGSHKGLVIRDCTDGHPWFISTTFAADRPTDQVYLHRCNEVQDDPAAERCDRTDLMETAGPPLAGGDAVLLGVRTSRFTIRVGVPDAATGTVPVTITDCDCEVTTTSTATSTTTTNTVPHVGAGFVRGACVRADGDPVTPAYGMTDSAATECEDEGMRSLASAEECEAACAQVGTRYRAGNWDYQPTGCFRVPRGLHTGNCYWNIHADPVDRDYDSETAYSRIVCTDRAPVGGSRKHPDFALAAGSCGPWCADAAANPGATGCEFVFDAPGSINNGCYAVYDPQIEGAASSKPLLTFHAPPGSPELAGSAGTGSFCSHQCAAKLTQPAAKSLFRSFRLGFKARASPTTTRSAGCSRRRRPRSRPPPRPLPWRPR